MAVKEKYPENTDQVLYITYEPSLDYVIEAIKNHFGDDVDFDDITMSSEHIQVRCFGYDRYDPTDYMDFIVVTYNPPKKTT